MFLHVLISLVIEDQALQYNSHKINEKNDFINLCTTNLKQEQTIIQLKDLYHNREINMSLCKECAKFVDNRKHPPFMPPKLIHGPIFLDTSDAMLYADSNSSKLNIK